MSAREICSMPQETGPCRALVEKFYYNPATRTCEKFSYGGCGGNRNNFESVTSCLRYCREDEVVERTTVAPRTDQRRTFYLLVCLFFTLKPSFEGYIGITLSARLPVNISCKR